MIPDALATSAITTRITVSGATVMARCIIGTTIIVVPVVVALSHGDR